ncbi:hypothetical protein GCM10009665_31170 [Kitasatospora nipponensis]|uniref:Uncharacterized protein n=1 Tax=Kitasatospora nipponensis TaxID=258049 RepID=A0ABP4GYG5_9ACTN
MAVASTRALAGSAATDAETAEDGPAPADDAVATVEDGVAGDEPALAGAAADVLTLSTVLHRVHASRWRRASETG